LEKVRVKKPAVEGPTEGVRWVVAADLAVERGHVLGQHLLLPETRLPTVGSPEVAPDAVVALVVHVLVLVPTVRGFGAEPPRARMAVSQGLVAAAGRVAQHPVLG
jgi:hypothetical protein